MGNQVLTDPKEFKNLGENDNLKVLARFAQEITPKGEIAELRLCSWFGKPVKLEKRLHFYDKNGNPRAGKAVGLNLVDVEIIQSKGREIVNQMKA